MSDTTTTPAEAADVAAEAVRTLNRMTLSGHGYEFPSDVDRVVANLEAAVMRLPQALDQAARYLHGEQMARRIAVDGVAPGAAADAVVRETLDALRAASDMAARLAVVLDGAHNLTARLAAGG